MTDTTPAEMRVHADLIADRYNIQDGEAALWRAMVHVVQAARNLADVIDLHRPVPIYEDADHCDCADKESHDVIEADGGMWLCAATPLGYSICEGCSENEYDEPTTWPCETVRIARGETNERGNHER